MTARIRCNSCDVKSYYDGNTEIYCPSCFHEEEKAWSEVVDNWKNLRNKERQKKEKLLKALRTAKTRLQICYGRMDACNIGMLKKSASPNHEVSIIEIPLWIEEMDALLHIGDNG